MRKDEFPLIDKIRDEEYAKGIEAGIEIAAEKLENAFECNECPAKEYCRWKNPCKDAFIKFFKNSEVK